MERLDGLDASYFAPITPDERSMAFDFILERLVGAGSIGFADAVAAL